MAFLDQQRHILRQMQVLIILLCGHCRAGRRMTVPEAPRASTCSHTLLACAPETCNSWTCMLTSDPVSSGMMM